MPVKSEPLSKLIAKFAGPVREKQFHVKHQRAAVPYKEARARSRK